MKALLAAVAVSINISILAIPGAAFAADKGTAAEAIAMVKKAVALIKSDGKEKAYAAFSDRANTSFHDRDLYIFVYDLNGVAVAHGNNPKMVGKPLIDLKDNEGKPLVKEMVDVAKLRGRGWVKYKWPNPVAKTIESKSSYVERVDDVLVGSGIYK
ncbi:cache domain-containing protein [Rugamonas sp.]|uniref:cache domain-containing protein n=1 Tax=Rugamonas sp. TaxID=1926287 RepID=UPI0025F512FF|nr:cache domain-containing protein [Rugamonas sp.]